MTEAPTAAAGGEDINALAKGGRTNMLGFLLRLAARLPFLFIAGRAYGPDIVGRYAIAVLVIEFAALVATLGLKRGLAQALSKTERPHTHVVWDAMAVAFIAALIVSGLLVAFPQALFPNSPVMGLERFLALVVVAIALSDVSLAALAYRHNIGASVTARAIIEPWTISIAAAGFAFIAPRDGLVLAYVTSMTAAVIASLVPFVREYGLPYGWRPRLADIWTLARRNAPLAGADTIEWATRNVDRFMLALIYPPAVVGIYYMAQQVSSVPQKLKSSFDPILGPVVTKALADEDRKAVARQVYQVGFWILGAQAALAVMFSIPSEGVMGLLGKDFVAGWLALCVLLVAEVLASPGAVCETALVYIARHTNLAISISVLLLQISLTFILLFIARSEGWPLPVLVAAPAIALATALTIGSAVKALVLRRLLGAPVVSIRPSFFAAIAIACLVGAAFMSLPHSYEWAELSLGMPAILVTYLFVIIKFGFGPEDRALFRKAPAAAPTLPENAEA
ncbi:lipopolysaccharide biosynthesis protein [Sphingomonas sp. R-74633]|uniref:lipopolysaccharide biosynthesis protein n=1 Tax=Sphingomonas sp. R-74633 TaxID=2751188 RepID=UPI0035A044C7